MINTFAHPVENVVIDHKKAASALMYAGFAEKT